jgi:hypothetical protein
VDTYVWCQLICLTTCRRRRRNDRSVTFWMGLPRRASARPFGAVATMMRRIKKVRLLGFMLGAVALLGLGLVGVVHGHGPVKGWYHRTFRTPPILNSSFIEAFDKQHGDAQRERLLSTYQARSGSYGLRQTAFSPEGTPIGICLVVENGSITLITDTTHDRYGNREFRVRHPDSIQLGRLASGESWGFVTTNDRVYLKSYTGSKLVHCF